MRLECACNCDTMYVLFTVIPFEAISFGTHIKVAGTGASAGNMEFVCNKHLNVNSDD